MFSREEAMKVGYARVSTKHQADTEALEQQIDRLRKAGIENILFDVESGRKDTRKNFNKIIELAKRGEISEVVVTRLDRWGRNVISINRTLETLKSTGVKLTVLDAPMGDTASAVGWMSMNQIAVYAEFESRMLAERVQHGNNFYRSNLKYFGKPPFGYTKENSKCIPHPTNFKIAKELIQKLYTNSFCSVSRWLNEEHNIKMYPTSIYKWIHNQALRGHTVYKLKDGSEDKHFGTHEALLTEQEYEELSQLTAYKTKKDRTKFKTHFLAGLFRCGICGAAMSKTGSTKSFNNSIRFQCVEYKRFGRAACSNYKALSANIVKTRTVEELVKFSQNILAVIKNIENKTEAEESEEMKLLKTQLKGLSSIPRSKTIDDAIREIEAQINNLQRQSIIISQNTAEDIQRLKALSHPAFFDELSDDELRVICLRFIQSVEYMGAKELSFKFCSSSSFSP